MIAVKATMLQSLICHGIKTPQRVVKIAHLITSRRQTPVSKFD